MEEELLARDPEWRRIRAAFKITSRTKRSGSGESWKLAKKTWFFPGWDENIFHLEICEDPRESLTPKIVCRIEDGDIKMIRTFEDINPIWPTLMARGVFKLGADITPLEEYFGSLLSAHELLACRDEMPRRYWPPQWIIKEIK